MTPTPPRARIERRQTILHGHTLIDDYAWLRDKTSPEVIRYLEEENAYTEAVMAPTSALQDTLYKEMLSHIKETDVSVPSRKGEYWYYSRTEQGRQYPIYCRKRGERSTYEQAPEEVLLDVDKLAESESFMSVGAFSVSDDGNLLAYSTDTQGFRQYTLHVKDLRAGTMLADHVERVGSVAWAVDNRTIFYTVEDEEQKRQFQLYRHMLGEPHTADSLIFEEPDERFNIAVGRTRDGKYLMVESGSHTTSESRFLEADRPTDTFRIIAPRRDDIEYSVDHRYGAFFVRVNDTGRNFRLVVTPVSAPGTDNWKELIPNRPEVMIEDFGLFSTFAVASERYEGLEHLRVIHLPSEKPELGDSRSIEVPEPTYSVQTAGNREFVTSTLRYAYQSLVTPASIYEYDLETGASVLLKQQEVPGDFDSSLYASERVHAIASDGVSVPVSIVYRRDRFMKGTQPLHVYGYGSYGYSLPIGFGSNRLSLMDRGFVLAYAHIRGGGDMGKPWHDAGRLMQKMNTFTDFVSVVEYLAAEGYGDPARISIEGGSAGGLLMGAVVNMRPELFRAVISHVPFVDVMNTMLDASLPLTVPEYEEWGDPNQQEPFEYMLTYSPYDNLRAASYPAMLVKTSLYDSQVMYWEPAKYVARLRTLNTGDRPILLHTNMTAGHGGASGRYDYLKEIAFDYTFLLGS